MSDSGTPTEALIQAGERLAKGLESVAGWHNCRSMILGWQKAVAATVDQGEAIEIPVIAGLPAIEVAYNRGTDTYRLQFTGQVFDHTPDALNVAIQQAARAVYRSRIEVG